MALALSARVESLSSWHDDWSGLRVAVLGAGVTGFAAADTLAELRSDVLVIADRVDDDTATLLEVIGVPTGTSTDLEPFAPELIIVSPGFRPDDPMLRWAESAGVPVWGDIELAWRLRDKFESVAEWITITGTNGKTTTTRLVTAMVHASGKRVMACGNVGRPVLDAIRDPARFDVLVVELSSFQLHWVNRSERGQLSPVASACLNVENDHLDWHGSAEAYRAAKGKVYANTRVACVYNVSDPVTRELVEEADVIEGCRAIGFSLGVPGRSEFGLVEDVLCDRAFLEDRASSALELTTLGELDTVGLASPHMVADVLAASALARAVDVPPAAIRSALREFRVDPHRTERVAESNGIAWIDDSKATNPHAADASLRAFDSVVWIVGGLLKGVDIDPLVEAHASRLRAAVVIGSDRAEVLAAIRRHAPGVPAIEVDEADTETVMPQAVRAAAELAVTGDTVLLAPAAASMDQFADYADRGRRFADAVRELVGGGADDDDAGSPRSDGVG